MSPMTSVCVWIVLHRLLGLGEVGGLSCSRALKLRTGLEFGELCFGFLATGGAATLALAFGNVGLPLWAVFPGVHCPFTTEPFPTACLCALGELFILDGRRSLGDSSIR